MTDTTPWPGPYEANGVEIYRESFSTIRSETAADLAGMPADAARVLVRMIHSCGMTDLATDFAYSPNAVKAARQALLDGAPVLCDAQMVASGITRARLPRDNEIVCTLNEPACPNWRPSWRPPAAPPPSICGWTGWRAVWWPSATPRPRCSACSS